MHKILTFCSRTWPLILIISITFLLRIYKIEDLFYFTYDESIPAFVGRRLILWHHLPLIGGVTPFGVHLTPYFYWFLGFLLSISNLNPIIWGYIGALLSAATVFIIYLVGSSFGNKKIGFLASVFWAFSALANIYDRHLWALYWGPLLSLIFIFSLYKIIKGSQKYVFAIAAASIVAISTDPSNLIFLILTALVWLIYKIPIRKSTLICMILVALSLAPIIAFDFKHNFANTKPLITFLQKGSNEPGFTTNDFYDHSSIFPDAFARLAYSFGDNQVAKQYSYCQSFVAEKYSKIPFLFTVFAALALIYFMYWSFKKNKNPGWQLISLLITLYFFGIQLYGTIFKADIFEHYVVGVFPLFILVLAKIITNLPGKTWILLMSFFIIFNLQKLAHARNDHGLTDKRLAIEFSTRLVGDKPFSLESLSTCWKLSGYRYLFAVYGREPVKSYVDPNLGYLYGTTPIATKHPSTVVAIVTHDFLPESDAFYRRYALFKSHENANSIFGNIEVIIMNNESEWFDKVN